MTICKNGTTIISYQDNHIKNYYVHYSLAPDLGYPFLLKKDREQKLAQIVL